jgi:hypothetical protein
MATHEGTSKKPNEPIPSGECRLKLIDESKPSPEATLLIVDCASLPSPIPAGDIISEVGLQRSYEVQRQVIAGPDMAIRVPIQIVPYVAP